LRVLVGGQRGYLDLAVGEVGRQRAGGPVEVGEDPDVRVLEQLGDALGDPVRAGAVLDDLEVPAAVLALAGGGDRRPLAVERDVDRERDRADGLGEDVLACLPVSPCRCPSSRSRRRR
jgi:hypothetical protein